MPKRPRIRIDTSAKAIAKLDKKVNKVARRAVTGEKKYFEQNFQGNPDNLTGVIIDLNDMAQGLTDITRVGNRTALDSIDIRLTYTGALTDDCFCRMILLQDKQVNGANITLANLLEFSAIDQQIISGIEKNFSKRIKVLWNKVISLNTVTNTNRFVKKFKKLKINTQYSGIGAGVANIMSNSLTLYVFSNILIANNPPQLTVSTRLRYFD